MTLKEMGLKLNEFLEAYPEISEMKFDCDVEIHGSKSESNISKNVSIKIGTNNEKINVFTSDDFTV